MDDKNVLLNQLRIDRSADVESDGSTRRWVLIVSSVVLVLALGAGAYWFLTKPSGIPVADAVAKDAPGGSVSGGGKATGASMLDASGYVVARRSALPSRRRPPPECRWASSGTTMPPRPGRARAPRWIR